MEQLATALPWFSAAVTVLSVVSTLLATEDPARRADLQQTLFLYPAGFLTVGLLYVLGAAGGLTIGITAVAHPDAVEPLWAPIGWGLIILAAAPAFPVGYAIHLRQQLRRTLHNRPDDPPSR